MGRAQSSWPLDGGWVSETAFIPEAPAKKDLHRDLLLRRIDDMPAILRHVAVASISQVRCKSSLSAPSDMVQDLPKPSQCRHFWGIGCIGIPC
ncbi:hypothetical protein PG995_002331 [Apiospora arundinis]